MLSMRNLSNKIEPTLQSAPTAAVGSEDEIRAELEQLERDFYNAYEANDQQLLTAVRTKRDALQQQLANIVRERQILEQITNKRKAEEAERARLDRIAKLDHDTVRTRAELVQAAGELEAQARLFSRVYGDYTAALRAFDQHRQVLRAAGAVEEEHTVAVTRLAGSFVSAADKIATELDGLDEFRRWLGDAKTLEQAQQRNNQAAIAAEGERQKRDAVENPHPDTEAAKLKPRRVALRPDKATQERFREGRIFRTTGKLGG